MSLPSMKGQKEVALIRAILDDRKDLFGDLIAPHVTPLLRTLRATFGNHPDLEDIVQQTALKALTHLEQFRFEASFRTWLIRIGLNQARQWRRKCESSRVVAFDPAILTKLPAADESHSPLVECQRREAIARVRAVVAGLPERYRIVILLLDLEELSISEVARRLGLTISGTKVRHWRARRKMAEFLRRNQGLFATPVSLRRQSGDYSVGFVMDSQHQQPPALGRLIASYQGR
jgi:RNA polymerase sigma factor (sigma-70 family)